MVNEAKLINAFSPAYVSQIEPFRRVPVKRPNLTTPSYGDNINTVSESEAEQKKFKLFKSRI